MKKRKPLASKNKIGYNTLYNILNTNSRAWGMLVIWLFTPLAESIDNEVRHILIEHLYKNY